MARNYKRKSIEDYSEYEIMPRDYSRGERRKSFERTSYLRDEEDGYHLHFDLNLNKEVFNKLGNVARKLVGGILNYVDSSDDRYNDRYDDYDRRDTRNRRSSTSKGSYPERPRRRY